MSEFIQVFTTIDSEAGAQSLSNVLVDKRLAACVQIIGPITSTYHWQGQVETSREWLCLIKSEQSLYGQLEQVLKEIHPYDVPEILSLPVMDGNADYLDWIHTQLTSSR